MFVVHFLFIFIVFVHVVCSLKFSSISFILFLMCADCLCFHHHPHHHLHWSFFFSLSFSFISSSVSSVVFFSFFFHFVRSFLFPLLPFSPSPPSRLLRLFSWCYFFFACFVKFFCFSFQTISIVQNKSIYILSIMPLFHRVFAALSTLYDAVCVCDWVVDLFLHHPVDIIIINITLDSTSLLTFIWCVFCFWTIERTNILSACMMMPEIKQNKKKKLNQQQLRTISIEISACIDV